MLVNEFSRLKRGAAPLSLIMLDIDHFKLFNDRHGHLAGDDCLRQLGALLKNGARRAADTTARYGGEEFVVVLPETDPAGALALAEGIRRSIEALAIPVGGEAAAWVTVSLGVVTIYPDTCLAAGEQAVALADEALYAAKAGGRNRTCVAVEHVPAESLVI